MAKRPTTTPTPAPAAAPAPSQPWAAGDNPGTPAPSENPTPNEPASPDAPAPVDNGTSEQEAAQGNGGGTDLPRSDLGEDAPRGNIYDEAGNELQTTDVKSDPVNQPPLAPGVEVPTKVFQERDKAGAISPAIGVAGSSARAEGDEELRDMVSDLSDEERDEFETAVQTVALETLRGIKRRRQATEISANIIDGNQHFGTLAEKATRDSAADAGEAEGDSDDTE